MHSAPLRRAIAVALSAALAAAPAHAAARTPGSYDALLTLFREWRAFQHAPRVAGVPDYSVRAMHARTRTLPGWQGRLVDIDTTGWTIAQRVDWHIVRAEMYGMMFDLRVRKPWATNPAFYVTVFADRSDQPAREGEWAEGSIELWAETFPLSPARVEAMRAGLRAIPVLLRRARLNLTGTGHDLWQSSVADIRAQSAALASLIGKLPASLLMELHTAQTATYAYAAWVEAQAPRKTGPSGIGIANYDWYLKHVQLVPYTWQDEVTLMERELARSQALLALEERRNAAIPDQVPLANQEEHTRLYTQGVTDYMAFLTSHDIMTIEPYMDPALRAQTGHFIPGPREFFYEVDYRDPEIMRTHGFHWFDLARMAERPHSDVIRREPLLYNIFVTRTEGHATGWEEMMLQAGMFDSKPRSRELIYILLAERAARAMGDLRMHANQMTLEQASQFASDFTPRGWLRMTGALVRSEQHLYLTQPAYGTSYVTGKLIIDRLLADWHRKLGGAFRMRPFMDTFTAAGLIPASLLAWEMTGGPPPAFLR